MRLAFGDEAPVREQLWLLAHDEDKHLRPLIGLGALGIGLAGAAVIDLLIADRVELADGVVRIRDRYDQRPAADPVTDHVWQKIRALRRPPSLVPLLGELGAELYTRTFAGLVAAGVLEPNRHRLRRGYRLAHDGITVRIRARIAYRLAGRDQPTLFTDALCALTGALRLQDRLLLVGIEPRDAGHLLHEVTTAIPGLADTGAPIAAIPEIAAAVNHAVGDLATATF